MSIATANSHMNLAALGYALAKAGGVPLQAVEIAKRELTNYSRVEPVTRAAVSAGTTSDPAFAASLVDYRLASGSFIDALRSDSPFDAMLPFAHELPMSVRLAIVTAAFNGTPTDEGAIKALARLTLEAGSLLPQKAGSIVAVSDEVLRFGVALAINVINGELRRGQIAATNLKFFADLVEGLTPTASVDNPLTDLRAGLEVVTTHGAVRPFWIVDPIKAVHLATYPCANGGLAFPGMGVTGGTIANVKVMVSDQLPQDTDGYQSLVVDASGLAMGAEIVTLRASKEADLYMDDEPSGTAQPMTSLFQTHSVALLAERTFAAQRLRDTAVAVMGSANYGMQS